MQVKRIITFISICLALLLCSCSAKQSDWNDVSSDYRIETRTLEKETPVFAVVPSVSSQRSALIAPTLIAPGFEIEMKSLDDPALNGKFKVDDQGRVRLPYAISLAVAGLSVEEMRNSIVSAYSEFFRTPSRIQVTVTDMQVFVEVGGLVQKPGRHLVKPIASLDELIGLAGGLLTNSDRSLMARYARIDRGAGGVEFVRLSDYYAGIKTYSGDWRGGERIFLQSEGGPTGSTSTLTNDPAIQMLGSIKNPGEYKFDSQVDFFGYLSKSGGPTPEADLDNIEIIRTVGDSKRTMSFSMRKVSSVPILQGGDIVLIHSNSPNYAITNTASIVGALAAIAIAIFAAN